jgi:tRNA nucleotidyltransferase (CCA-adding enzyme)
VEEAKALERLRAAVPANVRAVCETLEGAGYQAVTVGGAVRDAILGRKPGDWDVATSAHPEQVMALFKHTVPTGLQHGTVTIVTGRGQDSHVEVTTFRGEGAYTDARRPDHVVFGVPLVEDLARRDLRVNAMAYDPAKDQLIDPFGGQRDIDDKLLRAVGPGDQSTGNVYEDAVGRFTEDGLRVMRAVRFAAQLEFALDPDTERGIVPALPSLAKVSKERISDELRKILATREPSRALAIAERTRILAQIAPELVEAFEAWDTAGGGRDRGLEAWLAGVDRTPVAARLGAMFAELAGPDPQTPRCLDRDAAKRAEAVLRRLKFSNDEIATASVIVGAISATLVTDWTEADARHLLADITRGHAASVIAVWRARGAESLARTVEAILSRGDALAISDLVLSGNELIDALQLTRGPLVGRLLRALLDRVLDDPTLNTRDKLVELARSLELSLAR